MQNSDTTEFLGLLLLLSWIWGLIALYVLFRRSRRLKKQKEMLQAQLRSQQTALRQLSEPLASSSHLKRDWQVGSKLPMTFEFPTSRISPDPVEATHKPQMIAPLEVPATLWVLGAKRNGKGGLHAVLEGRAPLKEFPTGEAALQYLEGGKKEGFALPHLIISEAKLPDMSGHQFLEKLKNSRMYFFVPLLMLTSRDMAMEEFRALRLGIDDFVLHPLRERILLNRIITLLKRQGNRGKVIVQGAGLHAGHFIAEEMQWLARCEDYLLEHIGDFDLNAEKLADSMALSRTLLFQRVKSLTGLTLNEYIREIRLQEARRMLIMQPSASVKSVALSVGFKDVKYFSQQFNKAYGRLPSKYPD